VGVGHGGVCFCFEVPSWRAALPFVIELSQPFRQANDDEFVKLLNEVRTGQPSVATLDTLAKLDVENHKSSSSSSSRRVKLEANDSNIGVVATKLFCRNKEVDEVNLSELEKLTGA
jgi:hypothetical protein